MISVRYKQKILWIVLNIFVFSIPLSSFASVRLLVLALVLGLFAGNIKYMPLSIARNAWDLLLFYLTLLFGLIYTTDLSAGARVLETSFSLIALPLLFAFDISMSRERIRKLFSIFLLGLVMGCLIMIVSSFYRYRESLDISEFTYNNLTYSLGFQPTYYAYYIILGICGCLYGIYYDWLNGPLWLIITVMTFLFLMLNLTGGVTALIGLIFILSFFILKFLLDKSTPRKGVVMGLSSLMLFLVLISSYYDLLDMRSEFQTDYWERGILWRLAIDANPQPFLGVGTGDYREVLNHYFIAHNLRAFAEESLNSHNQYIQSYFSNGIIGLISLLIIILRPLYFSFRDQNPLGILLLFPFIIYGVTEVFLGRYQGVVLFAFVHQLVMVMHQAQKKNRFAINNGLAGNSIA